MTPEAVLLSACALLGIRDPAEFYLLPGPVREGWLEHVTNLATGAYGKRQTRKGDPSAAQSSVAAEKAFMASKRKGGPDEPR